MACWRATAVVVPLPAPPKPPQAAAFSSEVLYSSSMLGGALYWSEMSSSSIMMTMAEPPPSPPPPEALEFGSGGATRSVATHSICVDRKSSGWAVGASDATYSAEDVILGCRGL